MNNLKKLVALLLLACVLMIGMVPAMAETTTITCMLWDRGDAPAGGTIENNKMSEWINEQIAPLGIQVEFVSTPRSGSGDKVTTWMAGGSAPDIIFDYSQGLFINFAIQGGLTDMTEAYERLGDNIKEYVGMVANMGNLDGHQYAFLSRRGTEWPRHTAYIRQDWLDELGLPLPTTKEELIDTLYKFRKPSRIAFRGR